MGRPYKQELEAIRDTYEYMNELDVSMLYPFFTFNCNCPLLIIGSGGSYAVAKAFELCYQRFGGFAKAITPYALKEERYVLGKSKILIVTAGGNNPDTVGVYNYVRLYEPVEMCVICMSKGSKIAKEVRVNEDALLLETSIPFGKDGYLAVNSTVAMFTIVKMILDQIEHNSKKELDISDLSLEKDDIQRSMKKCTNLIVLYGGWGTPAAFDLESKCSEAGLISVQFIDYRNFSHGRHNWIDKNRDTTMIVTLITSEDKVIRDKTMDKLPMDLPRIDMITEKKGSLAALELLIQVFYFVDYLGEVKGIDPGRPHVPEFGSKLYNIKYNLKINDLYLKSILKSRKEACIYRKTKDIRLDREWHDYYSVMYDKFVHKLCSVKYGALILDFDGTVWEREKASVPQFIVDIMNELLRNDIVLGFATGRGDSIIEILKGIIEKEYWQAVIIGYYNASRISYLNDTVDFDVNCSQTLRSFEEYVIANPVLKDKIINRGYQLSIRESDRQKLDLYYEILNELKMSNGFSDIKICKAGHAVDIIEGKSGKQRMVDFVKRKQDLNILCIGDEGRIFENDFELLSIEYGVSSNSQNWLAESGWNLAPLGIKNVRATQFYFEKMRIERNFFTIQDL